MGDKAQVFYDAVVPLTTRPPESGALCLLRLLARVARLIGVVKLFCQPFRLSQCCFPNRPGEASGQTYHFVSEELFKFFLDQHLLKEWGQFNEHCYGSLKNSVEVRPQRAADDGLAKSPISTKIKACLLQRCAGKSISGQRALSLACLLAQNVDNVNGLACLPGRSFTFYACLQQPRKRLWFRGQRRV